MLIRTIVILAAVFAIAVMAVRDPHDARAVSFVQDAGCESSGVGEGATTLTFDNRRAGDDVIDQYADDGVRFVGGSAVADTPAGIAPRSGTIAVRSQYADLGSAGRPIRMEFTEPLRALAFYVGRENSSGDAVPVRARLSAYGHDRSGATTVIAAAETLLETDGTFGRCLTVHAPDELSITGAVLEYTSPSDASSHEKRWLDDLTLVPATGGSGTASPAAVGEPPASEIEARAAPAAQSWQWQILMMVTGAMLMLGCFVAWHWRKDADVLSGIDGSASATHNGLDPRLLRRHDR